MLVFLPLVVPLGLLIWLAYRGYSVLILAPAMAVLAAVMAGDPALATLTERFMPAAGRFVVSFFLIFLLGAVFGRLMEESGAAHSLATGITRVFGPERAIAAVVAACALLTFGGVSLFIVAFAVYPIARALFRQADHSPKLIPATIALGAFTFTMTALPGTPAIQNAIPMPYFGTTVFAAPGLGVIAALIMGAGGLMYLGRLARVSTRPAVLGTDPTALAAMTVDTGIVSAPGAERTGPGIAVGLVPIGAVLLLNLAFSTLVFPRLDLSYLQTDAWGRIDPQGVVGLWSLLSALTLSILLFMALTRKSLPEPVKAAGRGAEAALLPLFNTASLVGFGSVIAGLAAFGQIEAALMNLPGGILVNLALSVAILAGITGSASGGMSIALDTMGEQFVEMADTAGTDRALLHRVTTLATGGLDALPHNGAVVTLLGIGRLTHREAYGPIFVVAVLIPVVALVAVLVLAALFGSF